MFKHILVPTDGSELSNVSVGRAIGFAGEIGAKITFFYAQPDYPIAFYGEGALIDPTTPEQFAAMARAQATTLLDAACQLARQSGIDCNSLTEISDIIHLAIIDAAHQAGCDLIFMASHGRKGISGLLLGSETQKVLTHTRIPVLVWR
jgi:nucleotide-binding universal stress UspA family protein